MEGKHEEGGKGLEKFGEHQAGAGKPGPGRGKIKIREKANTENAQIETLGLPKESGDSELGECRTADTTEWSPHLRFNGFLLYNTTLHSPKSSRRANGGRPHAANGQSTSEREKPLSR